MIRRKKVTAHDRSTVQHNRLAAHPVHYCPQKHVARMSDAPLLTAARAKKLLALWDDHIATEFTEKSADAAVATMVPHSTVNHVPTCTGGAGREGLRNFYAKHFIPKMPDDVKITPLERNVGQDASGGETVVDEFLFEFTHNTRMDWMLPGVEPTGKHVSVPFIVVVKFGPGTDKLLAERIYWDQATVLQQIGLLPPGLSCVTGAEQALKAANHEAVPSNKLIEKARDSLNGAVTEDVLALVGPPDPDSLPLLV